MRIILTGSRGFLGSHLSKRLKDDGHTVVTPGRDNINTIFIGGSDAIINCAAQLDNDSMMVFDNVITTASLLDRMKRDAPKARFIQIGSSSEIGAYHGIRRENTPCFPSNLYDGTKLAATNLCIGYARQYNLNICIARPFTLYGLNDKPRKMLARLWDAYANDTVFTCYDGAHDWLHVSDFIDGIIKLLNADPDSIIGDIFHFGTGISTFNSQIVGLFMRDAPGLKVKYDSKMLRLWDVQDWRADYSRAKEILGWEPQINISDGIKQYVMSRYFEQEKVPGL